jgi:hypothetical protein
MTGSKYFVDIDGKTAGPFTISEMRDLYAGGTITGATLYAMPDSQEWLPVQTIKPLLVAAASPPVQRERRAELPRSAVSPELPMCPGCGYRGVMRMQAKGSFVVEVALWLLFCAPGLIYTLWRATAGKEARCPKCGMVVR